MSEEAEEFFRLHGAASIKMLKDGIFRALAEEDDARALRLDGLLREVEKLVKAGSLPSPCRNDSLPH